MTENTPLLNVTTSRFVALLVTAALMAGCQSPKKEAAPPENAKPPAKKNTLGTAIEGTGQLIGNAGKATLEGTGKVITSTGEIISGAGSALDKTLRDFLGAGAETINTERNVVFAVVDGKDLTMDVFWPKGEDHKAPFPMVVNVHGGSWYKKGQEGFPVPMCRWLAKQGFAVANIAYRLAPEYKFPEAVNDCLGAVIFFKSNAAKYQGDPARVAIMGDSAGANLASMTALCWDNAYFKPTFAGDGKVTAQTHANVLLFGVYDMVAMYNMTGWFVIFENPKEIGPKYMGGTPTDMLERYQMASPVHHVRKDMSPTLIICGADDPLLEQSILFHKKLNEMGLRNGLYISVGDTHGFTSLPFTKGATDAYNAINAFLSLELKNRKP